MEMRKALLVGIIVLNIIVTVAVITWTEIHEFFQAERMATKSTAREGGDRQVRLLDEVYEAGVERIQTGHKKKASPKDSADWRDYKPAAHVIGQRQPPKRPYDSSLVPIRKWNRSAELSFLKNGIEYRNGRLVIPGHGYYYVYAYVEFCQPEPNDYTRRPFALEILRYNNNSKLWNYTRLGTTPYKTFMWDINLAIQKLHQSAQHIYVRLPMLVPSRKDVIRSF